MRKQLKEAIVKSNSSEEKHGTKGYVLIKATSIGNVSKGNINSAAGNTNVDPKPGEIIFKVQILSSSNRLPKNSPKFKGLKNVSEYKDGNLYKYTVGEVKDLKSAVTLQSELREKGFNGAFVAAFRNGERIPIKEARKLSE